MCCNNFGVIRVMIADYNVDEQVITDVEQKTSRRDMSQDLCLLLATV